MYVCIKHIYIYKPKHVCMYMYVQIPHMGIFCISKNIYIQYISLSDIDYLITLSVIFINCFYKRISKINK